MIKVMDMKVNEMTNLWVGYNKTENFKVLILALDEAEAKEITEGYRLDVHLEGKFEIYEFTDVNEHFDCEYVLEDHGEIWG